MWSPSPIGWNVLLSCLRIFLIFCRILHPDKEPLAIGDLESDLRQSIAHLEMVVMRYLGFELNVDTPHNHVYVMLATLRTAFPTELAHTSRLATAVAVLLQDACLDPTFFTSHRPITAAAVVISLALQLAQIALADETWMAIVTPKLSTKRLQQLKQTFLCEIYDDENNKN